MNQALNILQRNAILATMAKLISEEKENILKANRQDMSNYNGDDPAMYERLKVDEPKIDDMIVSLNELIEEEDPLGKELYKINRPNGLKISNKTAPFGTILIIYESRPDVTVEATGIAFKSGNSILLKGGKESLNSNLMIVSLWHKALGLHNAPTSCVSYLKFNRQETQEFLLKPTRKVDLIVPRGGEKLIAFVKQHATCPVIVSGRGNNFVYVDKEASLDMALDIIINGKTSKISACNALDKVLIHQDLPQKEKFIKSLTNRLLDAKVAVFGDHSFSGIPPIKIIDSEAIWHEEFLDYKIVIGAVISTEKGIDMINKYGGGHSAVIITENSNTAQYFMDAVDSAAVYQNASTRFTDGGQFGLGGELAISTDKLHHRGPLGLQHLVTNKWYIQGDGQIR